MRIKFYLTLLTGLALVSLNLHAQNEKKCATMRILNERMKNDPSLLLRMQESEIKTQNRIALQKNSKTNKSRQIITIPVVVHVLWHDSIENISDAQIQSQIAILNLDFRKMNVDTLLSSHPFAQFTSDAEIEFCLASQDTSGNATTGITRTYTDSLAFSANGTEKHVATGGIENWNPTKYLNFWVCNLSAGGTTLGYAAFPADLAASPGEDGVVIRYEGFGNTGTAGSGGFASNNGGRTATHEVGHWLNLRHIWGDATCGDDFVADTKVAEDKNFGCPSFPHRPNNQCGGDANGEMYMNYMDYVDDSCMNMFTAGQVARMRDALNGDRVGILTSPGCTPHIGINEVFWGGGVDIYPNPGNGNLRIDSPNSITGNIGVAVYDLLGAKIHMFENIKFPYSMNLSDLSNGVYYIKIMNGEKSISKKVIITK